MGLDEGDMVVRRRLAQRMDFLFSDLSGTAEPSDGELRTYLEENHDTYEIPGQVSFSQVYFNPERRGNDGAAQAARTLAERLNADESARQDTPGFGDPFLLPSSYTDKSLPELRGEFGPRFARALWEQVPGTWQGPVPSGYGLHAVYVHERTDAKLPDFSELKKRLNADWMAARERELAGEVYDRLRERYRVLVEGMPYHMDRGQ
jgi:parvulin-like peptidyl-prolyl isomerase